MKKTRNGDGAGGDRLHLGKLIGERELTLELLGERLEAEGISLSMDGDGDIYVSDAVLGFPFWMSIDRGSKVIILYTHQDYETDQGALEALEVAQRLQQGPLTPQFFLQGHRLYAHYFLSYREWLVVSHAYEAACRFAEYAANLPSSNDNGADSPARMLN